jgi:Predicted pyridoxal phosphate-dependent enzyme apparently involved in regulation of cell wall biogenesis
MRSEQQLKAEILDKVASIYQLRAETQEFIPGKTRIHYAGRVFDEKEMQALVGCALDFWLTLGPAGSKFMKDFLGYMGMQYGIVLNSGSSANLAAVSALCSPQLERPLQPGDEVITPALAFPTTLNPILQNGLIPVFVDVEEGTYNLDAAELEKAVSEKTRAILFAHTLGNPADMEAIPDFAKQHDLYLMEDTCDALDSRYDGRLCGTFGDVSTFSFYAAHHLFMGEGGALLTNHAALYHQALSIRDWGRACWCQPGESNPNGACGNRFNHAYKNLPYGYDHKYVFSNIGYNLKPLDLQCAIGIEQLKKLPFFTERRKQNFHMLYSALEKYESAFILPRRLPKSDPSWFAFPLTVRPEAAFSRREIVAFLEEHQIETRMLFGGNILKHPAYEAIRYRIPGTLDRTENILENTFFIGVYPGLTEEMLNYIIKTFADFMDQHSPI